MAPIGLRIKLVFRAENKERDEDEQTPHLATHKARAGRQKKRSATKLSVIG
jgi:hypothetical protein